MTGPAAGPGPAAGLGLASPERENSLLVGLIEAISAGPELGPLSANVARLVADVTGIDACFVHVLDDGGRSLTLAGATPPFDKEAGRIRLPLGSGVSGWVASHHQPVAIPEHKDADPRYRYFPQLHGHEYTSMASVPMISHPGGLVGVLNVHTRERRDFTERDLRLLTSIGSLVAGAMHQARLHRQITARGRAHEVFAEQVIAAQEAERRRLAADIHDGITQRLFSLRFHLDAAADALAEAPEFTAEQLVSARELTRLALEEARAAISGLRPPVLDDLGLADALASLARATPAVEVTVDVDECRLPEHVEIALYRIAQEALANVVRHAGAGRAWLELRCTGEGGVSLRVTDDGRGFSTQNEDRPASPDRGDCAGGDGGDVLGGDVLGGYGMHGMAERAEIVGGHLEVMSRPGHGTTVVMTIAARR